jgi:hypothetical protein
MNLFIMHLSPSSFHFIPLRSKYSAQHLFSNTLNPSSSLNERDQVSHPYKTKGKIIVSYGLIFRLLDSSLEDNTF